MRLSSRRSKVTRAVVWGGAMPAGPPPWCWLGSPSPGAANIAWRPAASNTPRCGAGVRDREQMSVQCGERSTEHRTGLVGTAALHDDGHGIDAGGLDGVDRHAEGFALARPRAEPD